MQPLTRRALFASIIATSAGAVFNGPAVAARPQTAVEAFEGVRVAIMRSSDFTTGGLRGASSINPSVINGLYSWFPSVLGLVTETQVQADQLPAAERAVLSIAYARDDFDPLIAALARYPLQPVIGADPAALTQVREAVSVERDRLMESPAGLGPEAATLLPLALAVEYGATVRLGAAASERRGVLADYERWIRRMRSNRPGSFSSRRQAAEQSHDGQLRALKDASFGNRLGLSNFLIEGDQSERRTADYCVIFSKDIVRGWNLDTAGAVTLTSRQADMVWTNFTSNVVFGRAKISVKDNVTFGVRMIRYEPGRVGMFAENEAFLFHPGLDGEYCYIGRSNSVIPPSQVLTRAEEIPGVKTDLETRTAIIAAVRNANARRIEIALSGNALLLLDGADAAIQSFRAG
jgi:hypothetical protein